MVANETKVVTLNQTQSTKTNESQKLEKNATQPKKELIAKNTSKDSNQINEKWHKVAVKIRSEEVIEKEDQRYKDSKIKMRNEKRDAAVKALKEKRSQ